MSACGDSGVKITRNHLSFIIAMDANIMVLFSLLLPITPKAQPSVTESMHHMIFETCFYMQQIASWIVIKCYLIAFCIYRIDITLIWHTRQHTFPAKKFIFQCKIYFSLTQWSFCIRVSLNKNGEWLGLGKPDVLKKIRNTHIIDQWWYKIL